LPRESGRARGDGEKKEGRRRCFAEQWLSVLHPYVFLVEYGLFPHEYGPFPCEYYVFLHEPKGGGVFQSSGSRPIFI